MWRNRRPQKGSYGSSNNKSFYTKTVYYVKKFSSLNADISSMANWFKQHGVTDVVMESTEKYWIPVYNILEGEGLKPIVTHPKYVKHISGQKTDFRDAHTHGQYIPYGYDHFFVYTSGRYTQYARLVPVSDEAYVYSNQ